MREIYYISGIAKSAAPERLLRDLTDVYPEGWERHGFTASLFVDDPRLPVLLDALARVGWTAWDDFSRERSLSDEFRLTIHRNYDDRELEEFQYLELRPLNEHAFCGTFRDEDSGQIILDQSQLDRKLDFSLAYSARYVVSDRAFSLLEASGMRHIVFQPTLLSDERQRRPDRTARKVGWEKVNMFPWYEITSDYSFPPVSPRMDLRDSSGQTTDRNDPNKGYSRQEGLYARPELHYSASDVEKLSDFDLARTFERFGGEARWNERTLIASQRFYRFCREHQLRVGWLPVRVVPS